eukprot:gene36065-48532_t
MIGRLNHVAIAVKDLAAATALYRDTLGARVSQPLPQPEHGVTVVFVELPENESFSVAGSRRNKAAPAPRRPRSEAATNTLGPFGVGKASRMSTLFGNPPRMYWICCP